MKKIDPMNVDLDPLLSNVQGNILKGHGRDYTTHLFLKFREGRVLQTKSWLKYFQENFLTSFKKQLYERDLFKRNRTRGGLFASLLITRLGYLYLGFDDVDNKLKDAGFLSGMKGRPMLHDPDPLRWEPGFQGDIHAMILLADDDRDRLRGTSNALTSELRLFSELLTVEYGNVLRNQNGDGIEHFGYVDGVSQPLFLKDDVDDYFAFHATDPRHAKFDPAADTSLVLVPDPYASPDDKDAFGSYFVFRKLEQHVHAFKRAEEELGLDELGGAYIVGRFEDGSPVVVTDDEGMIGGGNFNNFNYDADPSGGRCPHFAHVRKSNPRRDHADKAHIMARRGIPFGAPANVHAEGILSVSSEEPVGLLFMSFQSSIVNQFEFIQQNWVNNPSFPKDDTGVDPIIGLPENFSPASYQFPDGYGKSGRVPKTFGQFVSMRGGEYFFAPSMSFFKTL
jgi:Dyp-type peroxidase family